MPGVFSASDLNVNFNPAVISFNRATFGEPIFGDQLNLFGLGNLAFPTTGASSVEVFELAFDAVTDLTDLQAPDFILATLTYDAIGAGTSPLTFSGVVLGDANGDPLRATTSDGSVTVDAATRSIPEPSTMLLVALGLVLLAWSRGRLVSVKNHLC